ncbi:MAG: hypothetical protein RL250_724 [Verrucomicrobiota bacterium]|jgi:TonB family protein
MLSAEDDRRPERALAWLAALVSSVLAVCVIGYFAPPVAVVHFEAKAVADDLVAEVFVPPPQAPAPVAAPAEAVTETTAPSAAPAVPDVVPVVEAVAPLVAPVMPGLSSLKSNDAAANRPAAVPVAFVRGASGSFPDPPYPRWARQQGMQGKLQLYVEVSASGSIAEIKVRETCGHALLDQHVLDWVKANWSWAPGARRLYLVPFVFELQ